MPEQKAFPAPVRIKTRAGEFLTGPAEDFANLSQRQPGPAEEADLAQSLLVARRVVAVAVVQPSAGRQEAEAVVVEQRRAGEPVLFGEAADGHGRNILPVAR